MDTHPEFRRSERHTLPVRLAVVAAALLFGILDGANSGWVAAVAVGFAGYTAALQLLLLPRFRSDAWIFGMAGSDAVFAAVAAAVLGVPGPAIAIPAMFAVQYALFLGYRGSAASAGLGVIAMLAGGSASGAGFVTSLAASLPAVAGAAALAGYIAESRFEERSARRSAERGQGADSRASVMLDGLRPVAVARPGEAALEAFARSLLTVAGFDAVAVYTKERGNSLRMRVMVSNDGEPDPSIPAAEDELIDGDSVAARASAQGIAIAIGPGGLPDGHLPLWAAREGYTAAIVAPMTSGHLAGGVAFGLNRRTLPLTTARVDETERFVSLASKLIAVNGSTTQTTETSRLSLELTAAGREPAGQLRPVISVEGLALDPATDRCAISGLSVTLSRSEFDLLYTLARLPGRIVDGETIIEAAFGDSADNGQRSVDATIYRLRRKLAHAPGGEGMVRTIRGRGYMLVPPSPSRTPEPALAATSTG